MKRCWRLFRRDGLHVTSWLFRVATNLSSAIMLKRARICRRAACGRGGRGALPGQVSRLDVLLVTVRGKSSHGEPTWRHRLHRCHTAFKVNFPLAIHCASYYTGGTSVHSFQGFKIHSNLPSVTLTEVSCLFTGVCRANISWMQGPFKNFSTIQCIAF